MNRRRVLVRSLSVVIVSSLLIAAILAGCSSTMSEAPSSSGGQGGGGGGGRYVGTSASMDTKLQTTAKPSDELWIIPKPVSENTLLLADDQPMPGQTGTQGERRALIEERERGIHSGIATKGLRQSTLNGVIRDKRDIA